MATSSPAPATDESTVTELVNDAVSALNDAVTRIDEWRDDLLRIQDETDEDLTVAYRALRSSNDVTGMIRQAHSRTGSAVYAAERRKAE